MVVVPVRLAGAALADVEALQQDDLHLARHPVEGDVAHATAAATAAANASTSSARVSREHIQRTSPVCSSHV